MADNDLLLLAEYARQPVVRDRNTSGLIHWSNYTATMPIPPDATDAWIRERIIAERIPAQPDAFASMTMAYFQQDDATIGHIHDLLNRYGSTVVEDELATVTSSIIGAFMPRFSAAQVTDEDVARWRTDNPPTPAAAARRR